MSLVAQTSGGATPIKNITLKTVSQTHADGVLTFPATTGFRWVLHYLIWSYSGTPTATITVSDGTLTLVFGIDVAGPGCMGFVMPFTVGAALTITASDGGSGVLSKINAIAALSAE